jgi:hypothetical protein
MASYQFNPINILDTSNATSLTDGGSMTLGGGISIGKDTFIGGNISISGTTTSFSDNILLINKNPSISTDTGIIFQRYTSDIQNNNNYAGIIYSEQNDAFNLGYLVSDADRNYVSMGNLASLNTKDISTGNLNFTGNLYKNGTLYNPGTQWTTTNSDISYTSGNVNTSNLITTNISGSNLRLSGDLYVGGTLSVVNVTTTNVVDINISTGTITVSGLSNFANTIATSISTGTINAMTYTGGSMQLSGSVTSANLEVTGLGDIVNLTSTQATMNSLIVTTLTAGSIRTSDIALNGNLVATGDITAFGSLSDIRLKTNIVDIDSESALNTVKSLRPVTFDWKSDIFNESKRGSHDVGFIAQEVEEVVPQAVAEYQEMNSGTFYKNIKHERLIPYLVGAIQKLEYTNKKLEQFIHSKFPNEYTLPSNEGTLPSNEDTIL